MAQGREKTSDRPLFRGGPHGLTGVLPNLAEFPSRSSCVIPYQGADGAAKEIEVKGTHEVDRRVLRICLPPHFPPGSHSGRLLLDGQSEEAVFEVDPVPQLRFFPDRARFSAQPGARIMTFWHVLNLGNVPVNIRSVLAFGIFQGGGIERSFRHAYVNSPTKKRGRMDLLTDALADSHGGLVKVRIMGGAGELAVGELRRIDAELRLSPKLKSGELYSGTLQMPGIGYAMSFEINEGQGTGGRRASRAG
jgi:hypothetical protein